MERKTKQRILGVLAVVGLVVILLPLFQSGKELKSQASLVKAPPFPDQSVQVPSVIPVTAESTNGASATPMQVAEEEEPEDDQPDDTITPIRPTAANQPAPAIIMPEPNKAPAPVAAEIKPAISDKKTTEAVVSTQKAEDKTVSPEITHPVTQKVAAVPAVKTIAHVAKKYAHSNKIHATNLLHQPIRNNGLAELKNAAWVIQIGSFKNKTNALRLVNQLRANGYRAFIQQTTTAFGENTRVFVGPEGKQTTARALANQLEKDMHVRGIVISYKPFTL